MFRCKCRFEKQHNNCLKAFGGWLQASLSAPSDDLSSVMSFVSHW